MLNGVGAEMAKVGANTPSEKVVVAVWEPEVPVTVIVWVPKGAEVLAVKVSVVPVVVGFGEKEAVTPVGNPETARLTVPLNPFSGLTLIVEVVEVPRPTVTFPQFERAKVGARTLSESVADAV